MPAEPVQRPLRPTSGAGEGEGEQPTREALLDAAEACFAQYGVAKTSMNDVARRAGLSRPTLYRYFADREALNVGVIMRRSARLTHRARAYIERQTTLEDKLVEGLIYLIDHGRRDEVVTELVAGETSRAANRLADSEAARHVSRQVWSDVLTGPGIALEGPPDDAFLWLVHVQLALIAFVGPQDGPDTWETVRRLVRRFVLPAFVGRPAPPAT